MKLKVLIFFCGTVFSTLSQIQYTGYVNDNNSGYTRVYNQPAAIVNSKTKFNLTMSTSLFNTTNYNAINGNILLQGFQGQVTKYRKPTFSGYKASSTSIDILGLKYEINHDNAIGYSLRYRNISNLDGVPQELTKYANDDFNSTEFVGLPPLILKKLNYNKIEYLEHMFNYARVIIEDKERFLKVGISLKVINGIRSSYYFADGEMTFIDATTTKFNTTNIQFGKQDNTTTLDNRNDGFGFDIGAVYEYRPDYKNYIYDMDGETNIKRYNASKYKYRIGVSITDIGRVKFNKDPSNFNFTTSSNFNANQLINANLFNSPINYIDGTLKNTGVQSFDQNNTFKMNLPTSFNIQFDYLVLPKFYINYSASLPIKLAKDPNKVYQKAIHSITPRYEKDKFSVMLPISLQRNAQLNVGLVGRVNFDNFNVFIGSNNISYLVGKRAIYNFSMYSGFSYNIFYTVPSDIDGDKISDPFDDCVYDPGPIELKGCPDTDGDGIPDKEDYCIYDKGPKNTFGCPDRDNDGVIDLNDQCPDDAGLAIHYGCPDSDNDGVIDVADQCPDVPGVELNNGCPFEITNCCLDDDGDTVPNSSDKCPTIPGSVYNAGCPIDKDNINNIQLNEVKDTLDANHTAEHVEDIVSPNRDTTMITTPETITSDFENNNHLTTTNIYFDTDDATIDKVYQNAIDKMVDKNDNPKLTYVIIGHTDNRGSDNYNLILSKKRAEIVKRALINRGVDSDQIVIYYYGEWKPVKSNNNVIERKFNRRVEVRIYE